MNVHPLESISGAGAAVAVEVENAANAVLESSAEMARYAGRHARTVGSEVQGFVRANPIASIGGALALGMLAGTITGRRLFR